MEITRQRQEEFGISYKEYERYLSNNETSRNEKVSTNITNFPTKSSLLTSKERRKSHQIKAMFRKTLSYQKRQFGTNLGCVIACPTILVFITFGLTMFIERITKFEKFAYEYCSNEFNGTFVLPTDNQSYKESNPDVILAHYDQGSNPCSVWFGTTDYFASPPYDIVPDNNDDRIHRDTFFIPPVNASGNYALFFNKLADSTGLGDMEQMKETLRLQEKFNNGDMSSLQDEMIKNLLKGYNLPDDQVNDILKTYKETGQLPLNNVMGIMAPDPTELLKSNLKSYGIPDSQIDVIVEEYKKTGQINFQKIFSDNLSVSSNPTEPDFEKSLIDAIKNKKITEEIIEAYKSNKIDEKYLMNLVIQGKVTEKELREFGELLNSSQSPALAPAPAPSQIPSQTLSSAPSQAPSSIPVPSQVSSSKLSPSPSQTPSQIPSSAPSSDNDNEIGLRSESNSILISTTSSNSEETKILQKRASSTTVKTTSEKLTATKTSKTTTSTIITPKSTETGDTKKSIYNQSDVFFMLRNMMRPWGIVAVTNTTEKQIIGERPRESANITLLNIEDDKYELSNRGILDYTYTRYFLNMYDLARNETPSVNFERFPYFEMVNIDNENDLDIEINERMKVVNKILKNTTFSSYTNDEKKYVDFSRIKNPEDAIVKSVDYMPYGGILINSIEENENNLEYNVLLSVGDNIRLSYIFGLEGNSVNPYMSYPSKGKRLLYFLTELNSSWLRKLTDNKSTITQGFRSYPVTKVNNKYNSNFSYGGYIGSILNPWGISFLIPIFVLGLVKDKEERYLVMMKMNGMKSIVYYIFIYITDLILCMASMFCFVLAGKLCNMNLFAQTSPQVLLLLFFIWSNILVEISFIFSFFFKRSSTALVISFLIVLISIILAFALYTEMESTYSYFIWPPMAFYYILYVLGNPSKGGELKYYQLKDFIPGDRIFTITMILIAEIFILLILIFYFSAIIPQEYGRHKPWHLNLFKSSKKDNFFDDFDVNSIDSEFEVENSNNPFYSSEEQEEAKILEDDDVKAERKRVLSGNYDNDCPLVVKNFRKEYAPRVKGESPHVAVRSATFAVEKSMVFGLLGPNGAGKTTLIHSLIGVYPPTAGYARVAGFNIETDMNQIYKCIGICPQHDILWNDLTVEEHLLFYARLKGISKRQEESAIHDSLTSVGLLAFKNRFIKSLSGGEKRRLSIAIALVGDPKIVFLDEPTTGLDPDVRRLIWDILEEVSQNKTIILTTHSMEEAEVLCHRIAIMSHGTLRCCNTSLRLKELYGAGFRLTYNNDSQRYKELKQFITRILPENYKVIRDLASNSIYEFIPDQGYISQLFKIIEQNKDQYGIINWGISQSSLEEVFLSIINEDDADGR